MKNGGFDSMKNGGFDSMTGVFQVKNISAEEKMETGFYVGRADRALLRGCVDGQHVIAINAHAHVSTGGRRDARSGRQADDACAFCLHICHLGNSGGSGNGSNRRSSFFL